jgi:lactoylglutathione lyase
MSNVNTPIIRHIALYCKDLEKTKNLFIKYFDATANELYQNQKGFSSYFLTFANNETKLEIMTLQTQLLDKDLLNYIGINHFAIGVGSKEKVVSLTETLKNDGFEILSAPRTTGDGYFESVVAFGDIKLEITV